MANIFNKKTKPEVQMTTAPEEPETPGEIKHIENLNESKDINQSNKEMNYKEVPVCLSQAQINNLIIENNIMLKQIISNMD